MLALQNFNKLYSYYLHVAVAHPKAIMLDPRKNRNSWIGYRQFFGVLKHHFDTLHADDLHTEWFFKRIQMGHGPPPRGWWLVWWFLYVHIISYIVAIIYTHYRTRLKISLQGKCENYPSFYTTHLKMIWLILFSEWSVFFLFREKHGRKPYFNHMFDGEKSST